MAAGQFELGGAVIRYGCAREAGMPGEQVFTCFFCGGGVQFADDDCWQFTLTFNPNRRRTPSSTFWCHRQHFIEAAHEEVRATIFDPRDLVRGDETAPGT
jgi:hypothetical protein